MSQRKREEERLERVIRGLLKLPENRRCINCNQLGPQYVCTTFLTFVCTTCSGVHREFNHRVKSVSMAKFTSEEVIALQAAGNERARQIYLKAWDPERNTHLDGSNINKIRDFIRHVYVHRRYAGDRRFDMHTMANSSNKAILRTKAKLQGNKGNFYEKHFIEKSGLGSREDFYERRYHDRSSPSVRSDRNNRDYFDDRNIQNFIDGKDFKNYIERRSPDSIYERDGIRRSRSVARFEIADNRNQNDRYGRRLQSFRTSSSDTSMSPEPQRIREKADNMASESQRIAEKASLPVLRPLKDIMGENPPTLEVSDPPKANKAKDANGAAYDQKKSFTDSQSSADIKVDDNKAASASGLIQSDNESELPDTSTKGQTESGSSIKSSPMQKTYDPPRVNSVEYLLFELSGLQVWNAPENPISKAASFSGPATLSTSPVASSTEPVTSSILPTDSSTPVASTAVPKASFNEPVTSYTATTGSALTSRTSPRTSVTPAGKAAAASSSVGNAQNHPCSSVYPVPTDSSTPVASSAAPKSSSNEPVTSSTATTKTAVTPRTSPRTSVTPAGEAAAASSLVGNAQNHPFSSIYPVPTDSSTPVASSAVPKASSNEPETSSIATTKSALTPRTSVTPAGEAAATSSLVGNEQNHPFSSVYPVSRVAEDKKVQTAQQHKPSTSTGTNSSTSPQGAPTFEAFFDQPMPSLSLSTPQKAPGDASADQSSQAVPKVAQTTTLPENDSKSTGRKELPMELFTFSYPTYPAPINNWQPRPPYGVGYGMPYAPLPNVTAFHGSAKSRNPFDNGDDSGPIQGAMLLHTSGRIQGAMLSSIASFPGVIPQMSPHAGLQPRPSPFASALPPESPSYGMYMSTGGYIGQQLPNNTPIPRPQGTGSLGGNDNGNTSFASLNPIQHSTGGYSSNLIPTASNSFSSAGGNPFA